MVNETARINFEATNLDVVEGRIKAIGGAVNILGGAVETVVGSMGLIGVDEKVQKQFQEAATSAIAFADGVKRVFEGYKELREAQQLFKRASDAATTATGLNTAATIANNTAQATGVGILGKATIAWRGLTAAIAANPITAIAVAVASLVAAFVLLTDETEDATEQTNKLVESQKALETTLRNISNTTTLRIAQLRSIGALESEITKATIQGEKDKLAEYNKQLLAQRNNLAFYMKDGKKMFLITKDQQDSIDKLNESIQTTELNIKVLGFELEKNRRIEALARKEAEKTESDKAIKARIDAYKTFIEKKTKLDEDYSKKVSELTKKTVEDQLKDQNAINQFATFANQARTESINGLIEVGKQAGIITGQLADDLANETQDLTAYFKILTLADPAKLGAENYKKFTTDLFNVISSTNDKFVKFAQDNPSLFTDPTAVAKVLPLAKQLFEKGVKDFEPILKEFLKLGKYDEATIKEIIDGQAQALEEQKTALRDAIIERTNVLKEGKDAELELLESQYKLETEVFKNEQNILTRLKEEYDKKKAEITKKYTDEEARIREEARKKELENLQIFRDKTIQQINEDETRNYFLRLKLLEKFFDVQLRAYQKDSKEYKDLLKQKEDALKGFTERGTKLNEFFNSKSAEQIAGVLSALNSITSGMLAMAQQNSDDRLNAIEADYNSRLQGLTGTDEQIAAQQQAIEEQKNRALEAERKKAFEDQKKFKIADTITSGLSSAFQAFGSAMSLGPILGPIVGGALSAMILAQMANTVQSIKNQQYVGSGTAGGGGGIGTPGQGPTMSNFGGNYSGGAPMVGGGSNPAISGGGTAMSAPPPQGPNTPIRAYVVANDVSNGLEAEQSINNRRRI